MGVQLCRKMKKKMQGEPDNEQADAQESTGATKASVPSGTPAAQKDMERRRSCGSEVMKRFAICGCYWGDKSPMAGSGPAAEVLSPQADCTTMGPRPTLLCSEAMTRNAMKKAGAEKQDDGNASEDSSCAGELLQRSLSVGVSFEEVLRAKKISAKKNKTIK